MLSQKYEINSMVPLGISSTPAYVVFNNLYTMNVNLILQNELNFRKQLQSNLVKSQINRYKNVVNPTFIL